MSILQPKEETRNQSNWLVQLLGTIVNIIPNLFRFSPLIQFQSSSQIYSIGFGSPLAIFAKVIIDKETNKVYLRTSEFISTNVDLLRMQMISKGNMLLAISVFMGFMAFRRLSKPLFKLYLSIKECYWNRKQTNKHLVEFEQSFSCVICFANLRDQVYYPCRHFVCC